jgi:head-tail adaptor
MTSTGSLDRLFRLEENSSTTSTQAADGYVEPVWSERAKMWCKVEPVKGSEFQKDGAEQWQQPMLVTCRYDSRISTMPTAPIKWRLANGDRSVIYDVITVVNVGLQNVWLEFTCVAGSVVPLT